VGFAGKPEFLKPESLSGASVNICRKITSFAVAAIMAAGSLAPQSIAQAQTAAGRQIVAETAGNFPQGGDPLKLRITDLCQQRPDMATEISDFLRTESRLNRRQRVAIQEGLDECSRNINPLWFAIGAVVAGGIAAGILLNNKDDKAASPN
jgi:deoxyribose-phosphate aldolase